MEESEEELLLSSTRGEEGMLSVARDEESGGVGGACEGQAAVLGGVAGVSHGGEREKAGESEGERVGESCSWDGEADMVQ